MHSGHFVQKIVQVGAIYHSMNITIIIECIFIFILPLEALHEAFIRRVARGITVES